LQILKQVRFELGWLAHPSREVQRRTGTLNLNLTLPHPFTVFERCARSEEHALPDRASIKNVDDRTAQF
jgi:hypothetical protein